MTVAYCEGDLQISGPDRFALRRFDDAATHGALGPMKAVDFIVERSQELVFLEIKDPQSPLVSTDTRNRYRTDFLTEKFDQDLKYKLRDTFLYEWASQRTGKQIVFVLLLELSSLTHAELLSRADQLRRKLPVRAAAPKEWQRHFVEDCVVMNIKTWNRRFPKFPIRRISTAHALNTP